MRDLSRQEKSELDQMMQETGGNLKAVLEHIAPGTINVARSDLQMLIDLAWDNITLGDIAERVNKILVQNSHTGLRSPAINVKLGSLGASADLKYQEGRRLFDAPYPPEDPDGEWQG